MKIGYFADGPWSHKALEKISRDQRFEISFIVPRFRQQDPVLKEWAEKLSADFLVFENVNSSSTIDVLKEYNCDLFVSMSFNQILKKDILEVPPLGFINCHAGELPFYRGRNVLNWAIINDEDHFSVTVHYIDEGVDTGPIILQNSIKITDQDNYGTVLGKAVESCADLLFCALDKIDTAPVEYFRQSEIHPVGFYCGRRRDGDEWINWEWSSRRIFNFIRSISRPGPCARTLVDGVTVLIQCASLIENAPEYLSTPGEVVGCDKGLIVKTGDSTIRIDEYSMDENTNYNNMLKIGVGTRFGLNLEKVLTGLMNRVQELEGRIGH